MRRNLQRNNPNQMGFVFTNNAEKQGKMFSTDFSEYDCQQTVERVCENLLLLPTGNNFIDARAENSPQNRLCEAIIENVELFLYAVKNGIRVKDLYERKTAIMQCLERSSAQMSEDEKDRHAKRILHVLTVWPNTPAWSSVRLMLCWVYREIPQDYVTPHHIRRFTDSCSQADTWKEAIESLLIRAARYPEEARNSYKWVFGFLARYGENERGDNDRRILVTMDDVKRILRPNFMQLSVENQRWVVLQRNRLWMNTTRPYRLTKDSIPARIEDEQEETLLEIVQRIKETQPDEAHRMLLERYDPYAKPEMHRAICDEEITLWIGEWAAGLDCKYARNAQQALINLLNLSRNNYDQVSEIMPNVLGRYEELDPQNAGVVRGCMDMLMNPDGVTDEAMDKLIADYCALDSGENGQEHIERIWKYLIQNYKLIEKVKSAVLRYVDQIDPQTGAQVQNLRVFLQSIYPMTDVYSDRIAGNIPHEGIARKLEEILACVKRNPGKVENIIREFGQILAYLLNANTANTVYRRVCADLAIYCGRNGGTTHLSSQTARYIDGIVRRFIDQ